MFQNDYHILVAQAEDRRREMQTAIDSERLAEQSASHPNGLHRQLHRQALATLGDALIAGGSRLKAAADSPQVQSVKA